MDQEKKEINTTGIGLGLTISQKMSKMLYTCGESFGIGLESFQDKGSRFYFDVNSQETNFEENLNIGEEPSIKMNYDRYGEHQIHTNSTNQTENSKKNILIVDDDLTNLFIAQKYMEFFGFDYLTANNGLEAYEIVKKEINLNARKIDLILMDCNMPIMDGYRATESILDFLKEKGESKIPIVAVTANVNNSDKEKCLNAGMIDVLTKPVKRKDLETFLNNFFNICAKQL